MSVEAREFTSEIWARWQGHLINGAFPLGRYLGGSEHGGVFLTKSAARPAEVAIKLVPTNRALAESQLPRWKRAGGLVHPHLLRLFEWGGCQLDGLPYLYTVMEYADQTLAQLLQHRALTEDEAREMLLPTLDALAFLHGRNMVQGQLKPANILVVGDQLKLASDTIRRVTEGPMSASTLTVYDPPEARHGSNAAAGDIWALGVSVFEALTRHPPPDLSDPREPVVLPADFSPALRDVVARCLSLSPQDRPSVTELLAWAQGRPAPAPIIQPAALVPPEPMAPEPVAPEPIAPEPVALQPAPPEPAPPPTAAPQVAPGAARPAPPSAQTPQPRALLTVMLGALVILALGWTGVRVFRTHRAPAPPAAQAPGESPAQPPGEAALAPAPLSAASPTKPVRSNVATAPSALHEVIPEVPRGARRTIRGHINVWVRVIVDQDGSVLAAVADRTGPSRYFQRLAMEAAKKWTFVPVDSPSRRLMQIRFDFSHEGTTGHVVALD